MTRSLFVWQPQSERFNSPSSPPECHLNCVIYSVKAAHTVRWLAFIDKQCSPATCVNYRKVLFRQCSCVCLDQSVSALRKQRRKDKSSTENQRSSFFFAVSAVKCQCHTQQLEVLCAESLKALTEPLRGLKKDFFVMQRSCQFFVHLLPNCGEWRHSSRVSHFQSTVSRQLMKGYQVTAEVSAAFTCRAASQIMLALRINSWSLFSVSSRGLYSILLLTMMKTSKLH